MANSFNTFILKELSSTRKMIVANDLQHEVSNLTKPILFRGSISIFFDWAIVAISVCLAFQMPAFLPLAILLVGSRQRGLSNLVHEAAHFNLVRKKTTNDLMSDLFAAFPMFDTTSLYRASHMAHHAQLGVAGLDPDSKAHLSYGYDDHNPPVGTPFSTYLKLVFTFEAWKDSLLGSLPKHSLKTLFAIGLWWTLTLAFVAILAGVNFTGFFAFVWIVARASSYHAIRIFAEFLDHSGLSPGSIFGFSRTVPNRSIFGALVHPHSDNYHLVHHLIPSIPHYKLSSAHDLLLKIEQYRTSHHCDGYLFGSHSAISCWAGQCKEVSR